MVNMNDFAKEVAKREKGKKEVSIAQIKEILKVTLQMLAKMDGDKIYTLLRRYGRK